MFDFLKRRQERRQQEAAQTQQAAVLADCQKEVDRLLAAHLYYRIPEQATAREELLRKAQAAGLSDHETVKRLDFLHRLVALLDEDPTLAVAEEFLAEADRFGLAEYSGVRDLQRYAEPLRLKAHGPRAVAHDAEGRAVYFQCEAEFKNQSGRLEFRDDGLTFTGEVVVEVAWSNVAHVSKGTHTYRGSEQGALAVQEGKRRTPTKFALLSRDVEYVCTLAALLWKQSRRADQTAGGPASEAARTRSRKGTAKTNTPSTPVPTAAPRRRAPAGGDVVAADADPTQVSLPPLPTRPPTLPEPSVDPEKIDAVETTRRPVSISGGQGFNLSVVGESHYQLALRRLSDGHRERGEEVAFRAWLAPEPSNPYDPNAVAVLIDDGKKIGYLAREWAAEYHRPLRELREQGLAPYCRAKLIGGCGDKANFGALLDVRDPADGLIAPF